MAYGRESRQVKLMFSHIYTLIPRKLYTILYIMINLEKFQKSTRGYRRLEGVTGGFKWLQEVILSGYRGLKGITESYKKIQGITRSYRKLHVQGIRGGYRGRQGIKRGYRGQKDIATP